MDDSGKGMHLIRNVKVAHKGGASTAAINRNKRQLPKQRHGTCLPSPGSRWVWVWVCPPLPPCLASLSVALPTCLTLATLCRDPKVPEFPPETYEEAYTSKNRMVRTSRMRLCVFMCLCCCVR